ncbi:hypothetical protein YERSI8AC_290177 [Enterobacterales bacterium 8AC]|nr:hypothetical protein YERSI8AC_290177 [Enterobacterales bacterium 8AC]
MSDSWGSISQNGSFANKLIKLQKDSAMATLQWAKNFVIGISSFSVPNRLLS